MKIKAIPTMELVQLVLTEIRPKLQVIAENLEESTTVMRDQVQRVDASVTDAVDRGHLQMIRADELLSRTLDRVEQTSDMVHQTVISPVRQAVRVDAGHHGGDGIFVRRNAARKNGRA